MKLKLEWIFYVILLSFIWYDIGVKHYLNEVAKRGFSLRYAYQLFQQDDQVIMTDCYQFCANAEQVTWDEYVDRFKNKKEIK